MPGSCSHLLMLLCAAQAGKTVQKVTAVQLEASSHPWSCRRWETILR